MNCSILLIPFPELFVLFNDPYVYEPAALILCSLICVLEQHLSDTAVPVAGKDREIIELAFVIVLHEQRIVAADNAVLFVYADGLPPFRR